MWNSLPVFFDTKVLLVLESSFLSTAGPLLINPIAHILLLCASPEPLPGTSASSLGGVYGVSSKLIAISSKKIFSAHPQFEDEIHFLLPYIDLNDGHHNTSYRIAIDIFDSATGSFHGRAILPFPLYIPFSSSSSTRLMLLPRADVVSAKDTHDKMSELFSVHQSGKCWYYPPMSDSSYFRAGDLSFLRKNHADDYGFIQIRWTSSLVSHGGALITYSPSAASPNIKNKSILEKEMPLENIQCPPDSSQHRSLDFHSELDKIGLSLSLKWLVPPSLPSIPIHCSIRINLQAISGKDRGFEHNSIEPHHTTTCHADEWQTLTSIDCPCYFKWGKNYSTDEIKKIQQIHLQCIAIIDKHGRTYTANIVFPMAPIIRINMDRDIRWSASVISSNGDDMGMLLLTLRLSSIPFSAQMPFYDRSQDISAQISLPLCLSRSNETFCSEINDPLHQLQYRHIESKLYTSLPKCTSGPFQPIQWESESHFAYAKERQWRFYCLSSAKPTRAHVRHLLEVYFGRTLLDAGMKSWFTSFLGKEPEYSTKEDLLSLLIGSVFHSIDVDIPEAARFSFSILRSKLEKAIHVNDIIFLLSASLLPNSLDFPKSEFYRRVTDIVTKDVIYITYDIYEQYFIQNYALWDELGTLFHNTYGDVYSIESPIPGTFLNDKKEGIAGIIEPSADTHTTSKNVKQLKKTDNKYSNKEKVNDKNSILDKKKKVVLTTDIPKDNNFSPLKKSYCQTPQEVPSVKSAIKQEKEKIKKMVTAQVGRDGNLSNMAHAGLESNSPLNLPCYTSFRVRINKNGREFGITAPTNELISNVMKFIEPTALIPPSQQEWLISRNRSGSIIQTSRLRKKNESFNYQDLAHSAISYHDWVALTPSRTLGSQLYAYLPSDQFSNEPKNLAVCDQSSDTIKINDLVNQLPATANSNETQTFDESKVQAFDILINQKPASITLLLSFGERRQKWQVKLLTTDRILKLRAIAHQRSLIPLSRCILQRSLTRETLNDRYTLEHYKLTEDECIIVSTR